MLHERERILARLNEARTCAHCGKTLALGVRADLAMHQSTISGPCEIMYRKASMTTS